MDGIVYTSNTGFTAEYAKMLGIKAALPVYTLNEAHVKLRAGAKIIYMGWLLGGMVRGYKRAAKRYQVCAVLGVGMGETGSQIDEVRKTNGLSADMPVFTLQGGLDVNKLQGIYKYMMKAATAVKVKSIEEKSDKSSEDLAALDMIKNGGSRVNVVNLAKVLEWYKTQA